MQYQIGQIIHGEPVRVAAQYGPDSEPRWFAFMTPPQKEVSAKAWLEWHGVEAWYPVETRWRNVPRAKVRRKPYEAVIVPRYIFARFTASPAWHVLRGCRFLSRVVGVEDRPLPISDDVMAQIEQYPATLNERRAEILKRRQEEERRRIVGPGDKVMVRDGALAGWVVGVAEVQGGIAKLFSPLLGPLKAETEVARLVKLDETGKPL